MNKTKILKYDIEARRDESEEWTEWATTLDRDKAAEHLERVETLGYCGQIVEKLVEVKAVEVVKALLYCRTKRCAVCVYRHTENCTACMTKDAVIVIQQQRKEIDRLTRLIRRTHNDDNK